MGLFSSLGDMLFGKPKRVNQQQINANYEDYNSNMDEVNTWSDEFMDPNSSRNLGLLNRYNRDTQDILNTNFDQFNTAGLMNNLSPAQIMANIGKTGNQVWGQFGDKSMDFLNNQWDKGFNMHNMYTQHLKGEADRVSNMHIQDVNAQNAARQDSINNVLGLGGMVTGFMGGRPPGVDSATGGGGWQFGDHIKSFMGGEGLMGWTPMQNLFSGENMFSNISNIWKK